ncbi:ecotropic viral integration site 5 protein-like protein [Platysternon megacephalum]|uniref:Ecotropic viral integration site 5 protein-like protein n=1 Tax=Platysternon megacephalum TaxID=55544 RepID=A0A4D9EJD7_9SAUR|nr:ecotropic viral integration site 5 protein-like protein [Platysternon megacephalum]
MARGTRWLLIGCGLCLALAVTNATATTTASQQTASSQHPHTTATPPQSPLTASGDTSLSAAPADNTTASMQNRTTAAAPASSRKPESASASSPPLSPASPSHTNTSATPAASSSETHSTEQPGPNNGTTASGSAVSSLKQPALSQSPGLVAVICIFVAILLIAAGVVVVKLCHRREPAFKKLDEVPMVRSSAEDLAAARASVPACSRS